MGLLDRIFGGGSQRRVPPKDDAIAREIVDRVVAATDARLKGVAGYQKTLRDPALATLEHLRAIAQDIPGPVEVNTRAWTENRTIRALFANARDVPRTFSRDRGVRDFFAASVAPECLVMLGLAHAERQVFAPQQKGDGVQLDVARTSVSFGDARILAPGADPMAVRIEFGKRAIDYLALRALERMTANQEQQKELEQERGLLKARLRLAEQGRAGLSGLGASTGNEFADKAALAARVKENARALEAFSPTGLMSRFIDILRDVLANPAAHLRLEPCELSLDAMNFRVPRDSEDSATLRLQELRLPDRPPYAIMLARFPRNELLPAGDALADAERYLAPLMFAHRAAPAQWLPREAMRLKRAASPT